MTIVFATLTVAALFGGCLAIGHLRGTEMAGSGFAWVWIAKMIHGAIGAAGFAALIVVLGRHRPIASMGLGGFGIGAEILLGVALCLGLSMAGMAWRGRRPAGFVVAAHATAAIAGLTLVLAIVSLR
ncbi:hypothetical protein AiwAL_06070 [Acidiphilium sp. AL]|nr:hypothetical protein [Acidiphilium sp. AL]